jgi:anti-anti-sigma factor
VTLEQSLTPAEQSLVELGEYQRLRDVRLFFQHARAQDFREAGPSRPARSGWTDVVVDLRGLTFMDSSGVHLLLQHHRRASETDARFGIIDGQPCVARTLQLCGAYELLTHVQPEPAT